MMETMRSIKNYRDFTDTDNLTDFEMLVIDS